MNNNSVIQVIEDKLTRVLEQLLVPNYKIENDTYLEILLSQISGKYDVELGEQLQKVQIFTEWLEKALLQWEKSNQLPNPAIQAFCINLIAVISKSELQFLKLELLNFYTRACHIFNVNESETNVSVKLAYIRLLSVLLDHESGIKWVFQTERWLHALRFCYETNTIYISRESQKFFLRLLVNTTCKYDDLAVLVFRRIIEPLNSIVVPNEMKFAPEIQEEELEDKLLPMLKLLYFILDSVCNEDDNLRRPTIASLVQQFPDLELNIWNLVNCTQSNHFHVILTKVLAQIYITGLHVKEELNINHYRDYCVKLYALLYVLIDKKSMSAYFQVVTLTHVYWKRVVTTQLSADLASCKIVFENQLIILQLGPILNIINILDPRWNLQESNNEVLDQYVGKLFKISCENTIRLAYTMRRALEMDTDFRYAMEALRLFMGARKYFDREQVITTFQSMIYVFHDIIRCMMSNSLPLDILTSNNGVLVHILDSIATLIEEFKITWRESVETICILQMSYDLLDSPNISCRLAILAFKLINLAIGNFMAPNLALLMNQIEGSDAMLYLGPLLQRRLHDNNWEVRDSALEVLHTITDISEYKFPVFQRMMIDHELITTIISMASNDSESYVRSTALKCISAMIKINSFWTEVLDKEDLLDKTAYIICHETEGIVRREAIRVIAQLHDNSRICKTAMPKVYSTMSAAAIADLHWEVKVNALSFWRQVICKQLSEQGMIDGSFPSVTFSKQSRKIVSLTESEIANRLRQALSFLEDVNCLTVLILSLHDDCDITVVEKAVDILECMTIFLIKYKFIDTNTNKHETTPEKTVVMNGNSKMESKVNSEGFSRGVAEAIESIVNADDISLLASVYSNQMKMDVGPEEETMAVDNTSESEVKKITATEFLHFLSTKNLRHIVDERNRWLTHCSNNLESLLDDMLKNYEDCTINNLDCY